MLFAGALFALASFNGSNSPSMKEFSSAVVDVPLHRPLTSSHGMRVVDQLTMSGPGGGGQAQAFFNLNDLILQWPCFPRSSRLPAYMMRELQRSNCAPAHCFIDVTTRFF